MNIYLLRHADAVSQASSDAARGLTDKGVEQSKVVGHFCKKNGIAPEVILASPYVRAEQTAKIAAREIDAEERVTLAPFLTSGMTPHNAITELKSYAKFESVMIVGHEPDLSRLASTLLGLPDNGIHIRKASLTALTLDTIRAGAAIMEFSISAKFL